MKVESETYKVLYDLSFLGDLRITGVERFAVEIAKRLKGNRDCEVIFILPKGVSVPLLLGKKVYSPFKNKLLNHLLMPAIALFHGADRVFFPAFPPCFLFVLTKLIINVDLYRVIHDTVYWDYADTLPFKAKYYLKPTEFFWLSKYQRVLTVSHFSRASILARTDLNEVVVVPNGIGDCFYKEDKLIKCSPLLKKTVLRLISVGTIEPRKNYPFLVDILEELKKHEIEVELIICGRKGWGYYELADCIADSSVADSISIKLDVNDGQLANEYARASAFVMCSKHEGFGIPLIEAMASGLPVFAANNSAMSEIVADYGVLIDGFDPVSWSQTLISYLGDELEYQKLVRKSINRSKMYTWSESAKVIEDVISEKK